MRTERDWRTGRQIHGRRDRHAQPYMRSFLAHFSAVEYCWKWSKISFSDNIYFRFAGRDGVFLHDNVWHGVRTVVIERYQLRDMSSAGDRNGNSGPDTHYLHSTAAFLWQLQLPSPGSAMEPHFGKWSVAF